jgi:hypothetical protein
MTRACVAASGTRGRLLCGFSSWQGDRPMVQRLLAELEWLIKCGVEQARVEQSRAKAVERMEPR